jgi:hypothetical protein
MFTPDHKRGFGLDAKAGIVNAGLILDWRKEPAREAAIRSFFSSLGILPSQDYLGGNGGVPDAVRILTYPVTGSTADVTTLTKRILNELCDVSTTEGLEINYRVR